MLSHRMTKIKLKCSSTKYFFATFRSGPETFPTETDSTKSEKTSDPRSVDSCTTLPTDWRKSNRSRSRSGSSKSSEITFRDFKRQHRQSQSQSLLIKKLTLKNIWRNIFRSNTTSMPEVNFSTHFQGNQFSSHPFSQFCLHFLLNGKNSFESQWKKQWYTRRRIFVEFIFHNTRRVKFQNRN